MLAPYALALLLLVACQAGQAISALSLPTLSADVIDRGVLRHDAPYILHMIAIMLAVAVAQILFATGTAWLGARIAMGIGRDLRSAVFARVQIFSLTEVRGFGAPTLITRTTNDVQQLQTVLVMVLTLVMTAPMMAIGGVVMAVRQDAHLSLLLCVSVPLLALVIGIITTRTLPLFSRMQGQIDRLNLILREQITGLRVIRAFVRDRSERARFGQSNDALTDTTLRVGRLMALQIPAANLIMQLTSVAMVWFAAHRIALGEMQVGSLVAFLTYIVQILIAVMIASMLFTVAPRALVSGQRIAEVLATVSSVAEPERPADLPATARERGEVEFRNVSFHYPGAAHPVVRNVSFRIAPGETVAVIGGTGSGKSTLVNLIPRLFDASSGSVLVGGVDVRSLPLDTLWSLIGLVPQETFLFSGTIADNLRYGQPDASDDQLWHALDVAQAKDFVAAMPLRLAAPVAQGGDNFSGGQRQRLAIARAIVRRPAICLFDDSSSALDYATDARLRAALAREVSPGAAVLIVGQRVNSLRHANRILVLDKGEIVGAGTHDELLASSAAYREIVESQRASEAAA
ncbi:ABC transporter ATP-binding protein [Novosphingobium sp. H3SJ31-1]|uniref:ABC transporter ATP-binding protein n=1 Tax=Novosphingobium album (ex Liu et al. 2023) TaxID=3031130 RepID=A0ABT5WUU6_9SPHN|nr:ABC transporter ATP-binding protein [Novosphingobium album (ex Liu et al. 2023)]